MAMDTVTISGTRRRTPCVVKFEPSGRPKMKWLATVTIDGQTFEPVLVGESPNMTAAGRLIDKILAKRTRNATVAVLVP